MPRHIIEFFWKPGHSWSPTERLQVSEELRSIARECFGSVPEYQCLAKTEAAFNDKLVVIARERTTRKAIAFTSAILLHVDGVEAQTIVHTGLTCILPQNQGQGLTHLLFGELALHLFDEFKYGIWFSNLAAVPSSLVNVGKSARDPFPFHKACAPHPVHIHIAQMISENYRSDMNVSEHAVFDYQTFVMKDAKNSESPMLKDPKDPKIQHRDVTMNGFYHKLLEGKGSEVLQIGFWDPIYIHPALAWKTKDWRHIQILLKNQPAYLVHRFGLRALALVLVLLLFGILSLLKPKSG
ncbi:hypothetical protein BP5796_05107 [Coleophoma crateriformis]|uniref:Uncharacterized protein n=1 Tax=Coleophoma crateriformis TaxID=565419 RepID=A0A3D8S2A2_9HELO|nr:hypothetical protein BP5796_05107 [Coleophoma crateriformis]